MSQSSADLPAWAVPLFPVAFVLFWIAITALLGVFSGWFKLQARFPSDDETPLLRLRMQSGRMYSVNLNSILTLDACTSGLRVSLWRIFGPFQRPFQIPWSQIEAQPVTRFFEPKVRLNLGRPEAGRLTIDLRTWERLSAASQGTTAPIGIATMKRLERGFLFQWLASTLFVGGMFTAIQVSEGRSDPGSLVTCFAFPAVAFGVLLFIRYLNQVR